MKKICFFSGDITRGGGSERVASLIANGLAQTGKYQLLFLSLVEQNTAPFFPVSPVIQRYRLSSRRSWIPPGPGYLPLLPKLRRFLQVQKVDVVIDIDIVLDVLSIPAAAGMPTRVVAWEHFHYYFERQVLYRRAIACFSAWFSDYMVTLTPQDKENYQKRLHRRRKIAWIYNPIPPEMLHGKGVLREPVLVTAGRLEPIKGVDLLVRIVPTILRRHREWSWIFLGEGSCRRLLEETARRYGLGDRLLLPGAVPDVADYFCRASLCVQGSRTESFGMTLLEAKACHVPCVCFDVPYGPSEMIEDGINGFLIHPFDLEQMEEKISLLIQNSALREQFRENTAVGLEKFQLESILAQWEQLLEEL